ncbi:MAG: TolC family protein [Acidobacteriota bacterium]|nr:TolC family protein [Acidobacteriota bacterium]
MKSNPTKERLDFVRAPFHFGGAGRLVPVLFSILLLIFSYAQSGILAQNKKRGAKPAGSKKAEADNNLAKTREEFVRATKEYKNSLEQLIALYEKDVKRAEEKLTQAKQLYSEGLISRKNLEENERSVADAKAKIDDSKAKMVAADESVAEMLVEADAIEQMAKAPPVPKGKVVQTTTYIRYMGAGAWSLSNAWKVQQFFQQRFGRPLPISAFGQSALHDRWGLDHRNAMDVGVNPSSVEGQALIAFLRSNGIPFAAFRAAIFGSATGPHIHIGLPSHRTKPMPAIR